MKSLIAAIKRAPKSSAFAATLVAAVVVPAALFAWGPSRTTYTMESPADRVTFNSITNNTNYGDERDFITIKNPATGGYTETVTAEPGKEYEVRILIHNNAAANLDLKALNTKVQAVLSPATSKKNAITSYVSADNAQPQRVHDDAFFTSDKDFNLAYVPGSARVYNNGYAAGGQGKAFSDTLVTSTGAKLGYAAENDGIIPGCFEFINYVYFKVKPQFAPVVDFSVQKKVGDAAKNSWTENLSVKTEQTVDYRIEYKNTGTAQQDNVVVKDQLPAGVTYVAGSSKLYNSKNPAGKVLTDGVTATTGINIGSHAAGANSFVVFKAKIAKNADLAKCGSNTLTNKATIATSAGSKSDNADVTVAKTCVAGEKPTPVTPATPTPVVPAELPKTGVSENILSLIGLGSVVAAVSYYVASRRTA
ncbi:MAG: hypothetical protein JWM07_520 [Candidatus Saccharibacteria bacterium]|nr:hypothetical protein [Candidatus Saccharibacteria bacterium]